MSAPELVEFVAKALVDHPDDVHVEVQEDDGGGTLMAYNQPDDVDRMWSRFERRSRPQAGS